MRTNTGDDSMGECGSVCECWTTNRNEEDGRKRKAQGNGGSDVRGTQNEYQARTGLCVAVAKRLCVRMRWKGIGLC